MKPVPQRLADRGQDRTEKRMIDRKEYMFAVKEGQKLFFSCFFGRSCVKCLEIF